MELRSEEATDSETLSVERIGEASDNALHCS